MGVRDREPVQRRVAVARTTVELEPRWQAGQRGPCAALDDDHGILAQKRGEQVERAFELRIAELVGRVEEHEVPRAGRRREVRRDRLRDDLDARGRAARRATLHESGIGAAHAGSRARALDEGDLGGPTTRRLEAEGTAARVQVEHAGSRHEVARLER